MSSSMVLCDTSILFNPTVAQTTHHPHIKLNSEVCLIRTRRRLCGLIVNAKNKHSGKKKTWWQKFFFDEDGNWFGMKEDEMLEEADTSSEEELSEGERFEAWKRRAEAISELREEQEGLRNAENRKWEDWLVEGPSGVHNSSSDRDWGGDELDTLVADIRADPSEMIPEKGLIENARDLVLGRDDDDLTYEDRVFQYASSSSAKFLVLLVVIPWALDFVVHDYVLMPFLDRYVRTVPLAAEFFDVRRYQKLEMIKTLKVENARFRFEAEIGKSPPLSDEEVWLELRHKARAIEVFGAASGGITSSHAVLSGHQPSCFLELRNEWRLENRKRFANILSDMVYGITLFILLYFNQSKVALLKFTGYKIVNNVSDTGKAFLIILITDIFLGYHSESGWQTLLEMIVEHYGLEVNQSAITIFVCLVPVVIDACVKLWLFKFLPRLSPKVSNIFQEMKRH